MQVNPRKNILQACMGANRSRGDICSSRLHAPPGFTSFGTSNSVPTCTIAPTFIFIFYFSHVQINAGPTQPNPVREAEAPGGGGNFVGKGDFACWVLNRIPFAGIQKEGIGGCLYILLIACLPHKGIDG